MPGAHKTQPIYSLWESTWYMDIFLPADDFLPSSDIHLTSHISLLETSVMDPDVGQTLNFYEENLRHWQRYPAIMLLPRLPTDILILALFDTFSISHFIIPFIIPYYNVVFMTTTLTAEYYGLLSFWEGHDAVRYNWVPESTLTLKKQNFILPG